MCLERIADGEMQGKGILKLRHVEKARLTCIIRRMQTDAKVKAEHKELQIIAHTETGAYGDVSEIAQGEFRIGTLFILACEPNVADVEKNRTIKRTEEMGAQFGVGFKLDVAGLVHITVARVGTLEASRAYISYREAAYAVSATHIELLGIGCAEHVAVTKDGSGVETRNELHVFAERQRVVYFASKFEELGEWIGEEFFVLFGIRLAEEGIAR